MMEEQLKRIADSLEVIAEAVKREVSDTPAPVSEKPSAKRTTKKKDVPVDTIPGQEEVEAEQDDFMAGDDPTPMQSDIATPDQLRGLAQKLLDNAGPQSGAFIAFIKNDICIKLNPKEPKLIKLPLDKIPTAAQMLRNEAARLGIKEG